MSFEMKHKQQTYRVSGLYDGWMRGTLVYMTIPSLICPVGIGSEVDRTST